MSDTGGPDGNRVATSFAEGFTSDAKRTGRVLFLCAVAMWPPMIAGRIILGAPAMTMLLFGSLVGFLNTAVAGRRVGAASSLVFVLVVPASVLAGTDPLAATCLMALGSVLVGAAAYWQRLVKLAPTILVGMVFLVTAPPAIATKMIDGPRATPYLAAVLVATAICALWPVVILPMLTPLEIVPGDRRNPIDATARYTVAMTVLVAASTYWAVSYGRTTHGVWLPLTIILVLQVTPGATRHRLVHRVSGTVAGAVVAALIATLVHPQWAIHLLLAIALLGVYATMGREPYWLYAFFLTMLILVGVSASEPALEAGEQRVVYTVVGAALALVAVAVSELLAGRSGRARVPA